MLLRLILSANRLQFFMFFIRTLQLLCLLIFLSACGDTSDRGGNVLGVEPTPPDGGVLTPINAVGTPATIAGGRGEPPVVFWPKPVSAHPDVPFEFTMVAYDQEQDRLIYSLVNEPLGMLIDSKGTLRWTPSEIFSVYSFSVGIDDGRGDPVMVSVQLTVTRDGFVFVAPPPMGASGNAGTFESPLATIEAGLSRLATQNSGTLYIRGGTYVEHWNWQVDGVSSPTRGAIGTADAPFVVRGYPGEHVVLDSEERGHGFWSFQADYWLYANLEIRRAGASERGGMILGGSHNIAQYVTVRDSNWSHSENCTGFLLRGSGSVCHRCRGIDNYDRNSNHWNSSNYLLYLTRHTDSIYIIDSYSENSITGYKIKHAGTGRAIVHGNIEHRSKIGFGGMDDHSIVRFNTFVNNGTGIHLGVSDPNAHTRGQMQVVNNTVVHARHFLQLQSGYSRDGSSTVESNIFFGIETLVTNDPSAIRVWPYIDSPSSNILSSNHNCWYAPNQDTGFRWGRSMGSFSEWQSHQDTNSIWASPEFSAEGYTLGMNSECASLGRVGAWE